MSHLDELSDGEKEQLCRDLLSEFGVTKVSVQANGEMIHSCCLPWGLHKNGDASPSASLNYRKLVYNCLGCQNGGSLVWFIGSCRGTSGHEARSWLFHKSPDSPDEQPLSQLLEFFDSIYEKKNSFRPKPIPHMHERVLDPWLKIHPYLTDVRQVPVETIRSFRVGWNEQSDRIVIPHFWRGGLVGWQTRRLADDGTPKYLSSPDFPGGQSLFNYEPDRPVVVVESPMSVLRHAHHTHFEATFGASTTDLQHVLIGNHPDIVLWMDNDKAGWKATRTLSEALEPFAAVKVVDSPWAADPADMDAETVRSLIDTAIPSSVWAPPDKLQRWRPSVGA